MGCGFRYALSCVLRDSIRGTVHPLKSNSAFASGLSRVSLCGDAAFVGMMNLAGLRSCSDQLIRDQTFLSRL
jgi:hypothetical protein